MNKEASFAIIGVLFLIFLATSPNWGDEKITVYFLSCSDFLSKHNTYSCAKKHLYVSDGSYRVFPDKQIVVTKGGVTGAYKLEQCSVYDSGNWSCGGPNDTVQMVNGKFWDSSDKSVDENGKESALPQRYQISRLEYEIRGFFYFFRDLFSL